MINFEARLIEVSLRNFCVEIWILKVMLAVPEHALSETWNRQMVYDHNLIAIKIPYWFS